MISIKTAKEIEIMKEAGRMLAGVIEELRKNVRPGISTKELDNLAEGLILKMGARCNFKGYEGFPACVCTSLNEEVVHAPPSGRVLREGDIITLDLGLLWRGFHSDMAATFPVGKVSFEAQRLVRVTKKSLKLAIKEVRPGKTFGDIGNVIQRYIESQGFSVIKELCGHGIGRKLHEEPMILNYGKRHSGPEIKEGMVFCLEPMAAIGNGRIKRGRDGFSYITADGSLSAHFEHMVAVTKNGHKVLTEIA